MRRILALLVLVAAVATGCAGAPPSPPASPTPLPPAEGGPIDLVGLWRVADAEGEGVDTWLRLDAGELNLWRDCGMIDGSWRAGTTAITASVHGASGSCATAGVPTVPWLESVATYERDGDTWVLRDAGGSAVATLFVDGAPEPIETAADSYTEPPVIDDEMRAKFAEAVALPPGLTPVDAGTLEGRWVSSSPTSSEDEPHVELLRDGTYTGSDGCNGAHGRWTVGEGGELLATSGPTTLIWCEGADVPYLVIAAWRAGFDGEELVLFDAAGAELGRLVRG